MRIYFFPAVGALLILGSLSATADPKTATPKRVNASQIQDEPYRFNGAVLTGTARGSGFCAWNQRTFFSAAHVVFGDTTWEAPPYWFRTANSLELNPAKAIQSRGFYRWTEYGNLASAEFPEESPFSQDVILAYAFEKLIHGKPATLNFNGSKDLKKDIKTMITGYPAVKFYTEKDLAGFFLYKTGPIVTPYESYAGNSLTTTLVSTGGGNSGGPIWTKNPKGEWNAAGVLVGGLPSESVVYAFSSDTKSLIKAVTPVIQPSIDDPVSVTGVSSTSTFFPYDRPETIPDGRHSWTSFRIRVNQFELLQKVTAVRLSLDIRTNHRGDLQVMLEGPGGYQAVVHNEQGAGKNDLIIKSGDYSANFSEIEPNGDWFVRVQDRLKGDVATLKSFVLELSTDEASIPSTTP
jgi:subtilisin-like proprotein convertase family protein